VCNRTGAALGKSAKLDGAYWRRHARQPVEFAKSVRTLADLHCTMLLEVGPQPVLTAAALRAWARPGHRARGRSRRCAETSPTTARSPRPLPTLTSSATCRTSTLCSRDRHASSTYPPIRFQHRQFWFREQRVRPTQTFDETQAMRTDTVRLLEDGRIEELAALLGGAGGNQQAFDALEQLAAQHNQQRKAQSITDSRYEIRWEKSAVVSAGRGCAGRARDMPGFSLAMTTRPFSHCSTCSPRVATGISFSVLPATRRGRGKNSKSRCAPR